MNRRLIQTAAILLGAVAIVGSSPSESHAFWWGFGCYRPCYRPVACYRPVVTYYAPSCNPCGVSCNPCGYACNPCGYGCNPCGYSQCGPAGCGIACSSSSCGPADVASTSATRRPAPIRPATIEPPSRRKRLTDPMSSTVPLTTAALVPEIEATTRCRRMTTTIGTVRRSSQILMQPSRRSNRKSPHQCLSPKKPAERRPVTDRMMPVPKRRVCRCHCRCRLATRSLGNRGRAALVCRSGLASLTPVVARTKVDPNQDWVPVASQDVKLVSK